MQESKRKKYKERKKERKRDRERKRNSHLNKWGILFLYQDGDHVTLCHFRSNYLLSARRTLQRRDAILRVYAKWFILWPIFSFLNTKNEIILFLSTFRTISKLIRFVLFNDISILKSRFIVYDHADDDRLRSVRSAVFRITAVYYYFFIFNYVS